jgi:hypothetical protein
MCPCRTVLQYSRPRLDIVTMLVRRLQAYVSYTNQVLQGDRAGEWAAGQGSSLEISPFPPTVSCVLPLMPISCLELRLDFLAGSLPEVPTMVYLNPDASPQGLQELTHCQVRRIQMIGGEWLIQASKFPTQRLRPGYMHTDGKALAILWCIFLEVGLQAACMPCVRWSGFWWRYGQTARR